MKLTSIFLAGMFLAISNSSFAEYFCISDQGKPKHCDQGDIVLVKPTLVPRVCDFDAEILRMPKTDKTAEYLCRYTGTILAVKELQSRRSTLNQNNGIRPPPKKKKKKNNKMFDSMPFFK
ncbi:MAG: hypothetical protein KZQ70_11160 [gamma proteobacterium symbiont of Lucinoma myriamae]|nr:hypothetical protein [gamma proteobacterium symbiont of Lucinoma myriamae]MCU7818142.1 hypothetical protein [gamma proteobacterium symbiont of Lucinoma myriamae]MCU7832988.1 hypothetical protein [gamma proteobacterium symbiont of Lucinoma myriamae]